MNTTALAPIDELHGRNPGALRLAVLLSPAARIEPALLRRVRLSLGEDVAAEADLWFSDLVEVRNSRGIVLAAEVAEALRPQLLREAAPLRRTVRELMAGLHRDTPWSQRLEEAIRWALVEDDHDTLEALLLAAGERLADPGEALPAARWLLSALPRLPWLRQHPVTRTLETGAVARLDGRLEHFGVLPADGADNWFPWLLGGLPRTTLAVALLEDLVEVGPPEETGELLELPATRPLALDVLWHDGLESHVQRLNIDPGATARLAVAAREVELRTLDGGRYRLRREDEAPPALLDYHGIRARYRPFFGREDELVHLEKTLMDPAGGWVQIFGPAGIGKTALSCALLDRLGAQGRPVIQHFLADGPASWRQVEIMEASLMAQIRNWLPPETRTHGSFLEGLQQLEAPVVVAVDGFRQASEDQERDDWWERLVRERPAGVWLISTHRDTEIDLGTAKMFF